MRVWVKPLGTTLGVAAAAAAAQLGIAYGIAILLWAKDFSDPGQGAWAGNLTWVCWLAATSVVMGVAIGPRVAPAGLPRSLVAQFATVATAAVGALVTVPLVGIPARYAGAAGGDSPATTAVRIALVGVLLGAVVAVGVLLGRPLEWNTLVTTGLLWLLALAFVATGAAVAQRQRTWPFGTAPRAGAAPGRADQRAGAATGGHAGGRGHLTAGHADGATGADPGTPRAAVPRRWVLRAAALVAGAVPALAFPATDLWPLGAVGLVPLLSLVVRAPVGREAVLRTVAGGAGFFVAAHHWMLPTVGPFVLVLGLAMGALCAPWGWLAFRLLRGRPTPGALAAAAGRGPGAGGGSE